MQGIELYGPTAHLSRKVGTITFNVEGKHHSLVAAILGTEGGIGVRNGCFCAHPYVKQLLKVTPEEDRASPPKCSPETNPICPAWFARASAATTTEDDIDALVEMLDRITRGDVRGRTSRIRASGGILRRRASLRISAVLSVYITNRARGTPAFGSIIGEMS